ncbi:MAG TPA: glycerophosphodiester phosphodiesterase family protein [Anaerolineales bacterium]|nr:glycerophosphodiester phosphodiesterase family protein [Anaerolineales bacterium]
MQPETLFRAIFAHRGASAYAPENTMAAFRSALSSRADGIELDVHLSADHQIVVIHDDDVSRTTNGQGKVHALTLEELRRLDAGQGEVIPTLLDVLELIGDQMFLNIELKRFSGSAAYLPEKVTQLVNELDLNSKVIYSSFDPMLLIRTRRSDPQAKCGLLLLEDGFGTAVRLLVSTFIKPWSLHPHYSSVSHKYLQRARLRGQAVITYTVNQPEEMQRLFNLGLQGIITDDPVQAIEVRNTL